MIRSTSKICIVSINRLLTTSALKLKNVDENQEKHWNQYSSVWWDKNGQIKMLHDLNQARVPFIRDGILSAGLAKQKTDHSLDGLEILEVGCGCGILSEDLAKLKANVTGLDASKDLLKIAEEHLKGQQLNLKYVCGLIEEHAIGNAGKYDSVVASEVIEHIPDQKAFLHNCVKCLKVGGSLFITTFNRTFAAWFCGIILAENVFGLIPKGSHEFKLFIGPMEVTKILKEVHCDTISTRGIIYKFWKRECVLHYNDRITYALQAIKKH